jgi:hypothetical protein
LETLATRAPHDETLDLPSNAIALPLKNPQGER